MQFKVPQNIDLEDKIIGPLTLMQFVYLAAGGVIIYITRELASAPVFWLIAIPVAIISLSLTFLKVQDQPFSHFLYSLAIYITKPKKRIWTKIPELENKELLVKGKEIDKLEDEKKTSREEKKLEKANLEQLSYILDTHGIKKSETKNEEKIIGKDNDAK